MPGVPLPPPIAFPSRGGFGRYLQLGLLAGVVAALLFVLGAITTAPVQGDADVALASTSGGAVKVIDADPRRLNLVMPSGTSSFTLRLHMPLNASPGEYVLQFSRIMLRSLDVSGCVRGGGTLSEYFYQPYRSHSRDVNAYFEFPLRDFPPGTALECGVQVRMQQSQAMTASVVDARHARDLDRSGSISMAAHYGILLTLALVLLVLHLSTGEPAALAYVWFSLTILFSYLFRNGHLFDVPGLLWLGRYEDAVLSGLRLLVLITGVRMMLLMGQEGEPPPRLRRATNASIGLMLAIAALQVSQLLPAPLEEFASWTWLVFSSFMLWLCVRLLKNRTPWAGWVIASMVLVLVLILVEDLADDGFLQGMWWAHSASLVGITLWTGTIGVALIRRVEVYRLRLEAAHRERAALQRSADTDGLTGTLNRAALDRRMAEAMAAASASDAALSVLFIDLDHFKAINDRHGHAAGDEVLRRVAAQLHEACRAADVLGRYGGEEFVLLAPGLDAAGARQLGERVRSAIEAQPLDWHGGRIVTTASVGIAARAAGESALSTLLRRADDALYAAKRAGRNRVVVAGDDADATGGVASSGAAA